MATGIANFSYHSTSSATIGTIDTVTLNQSAPFVEVYNRNAAGNLFVTVGTAAASTANPAALASDTYIIPPNTSDNIQSACVRANDVIVVKIVSDTASMLYSVTARNS